MTQGKVASFCFCSSFYSYRRYFLICLIIVIRKLIFTWEAVAWMCSVKKGVFRNFTKFPGKHLCYSVFLNKVAGLRPVALLKKRLWHRRYAVKFVKFVRTPLLQNTSRCSKTSMPFEFFFFDFVNVFNF